MRTMNGNAVLISIPRPLVFSVTGGGYFCGSAGADVQLSGSEAGVSYELLDSGSSTGIFLTGNNSAIIFSSMNSTGAYSVQATNDSGCVSNMTGTANIFIKPLPLVFNVTGGGNYCIGNGGLPIILDSSEIGINYRLYTGGFPLGGVVSGTGGPLTIGSPATIGTYNVVATNTANACSISMNGIAFENEVPYPDPYYLFGGGHYCDGDSGVEVGLLNTDTSAFYSLYINTSFIQVFQGTGTALSFGFQTTDGLYNVTGTTNSSSCTTNMFDSVYVIKDICAGLESTDNQNAIVTFPNPADDLLSIISQNGNGEMFRYSFYDGAGRIILSSCSSGPAQIRDLRNYASGMYLLLIEINGSILTEKIILNHN